jgi:hypothetical protein
MEQAASLGDFADKPVAVLTAGSGSDAGHVAEQNHLATLSTNSVHRVIAGASHPSLILEEEFAAATTQAILDVVSSARGTAPLVKRSGAQPREHLHPLFPATDGPGCKPFRTRIPACSIAASPTLQRTFNLGAR